MSAEPATTPRLAAGWLARHARDLGETAARRRDPGGMRVPPRRLRARTGAPGVREFLEGGRDAAAALAGLTSRPIGEFTSILDFGCGSARVLPHVAELVPGAALTGCDVDATAIVWATTHRPGWRFVVSRADPPLPFPDARFDLVYSISVLSHLDETMQDAWLAELTRVLVPGGTALLSVHGQHAFEAFRAGAVQTSWCPPGAFRGLVDLASAGFSFVPYTRSVWNAEELRGVGEGYGLAFHGEAYVRERWSSWLEVERIAPQAIAGWQDVVVARRRESR